MAELTRSALRVKVWAAAIEIALGTTLAHHRTQLLLCVSILTGARTRGSLPERTELSLDLFHLGTRNRDRLGNAKLRSALKDLLRSDKLTRVEETAWATRRIKPTLTTIKTAPSTMRAHTRTQLLHRMCKDTGRLTRAASLPVHAHGGLVVGNKLVAVRHSFDEIRINTIIHLFLKLIFPDLLLSLTLTPIAVSYRCLMNFFFFHPKSTSKS
jgi:hypothetical protein